ncbi:MAG: alpha/beta hydrolase [Saprospiraceae bacterium]|nr:alpha/beta hydrolase [Saprospiraceae bacterium]
MKTPTYLIISILLFIQSNRVCQAQVKVLNDISYLEAANTENDSLQRLNLTLPGQVDKPPLLIWIGGGAWSYTDRNVEMDLARQFATRGIAVASIGHRLSSALWRDSTHNLGAEHPDHIEDVAMAFKFLHNHAMEYGYDAGKIFIGGFSSGAHLASLLVMDRKYLDKYALSKDLIRGIIPIAGMYDVPHYHETLANSQRPELATLHVESVFGRTNEQHIEASPTRYVDHLSTPTLLISERDSYTYTRIFEDRIREAGFREIEILHVQALGHSALWKDLSFNPDSRYRELIIGFINAHT